MQQAETKQSPVRTPSPQPCKSLTATKLSPRPHGERQRSSALGANFRRRAPCGDCYAFDVIGAHRCSSTRSQIRVLEGGVHLRLGSRTHVSWSRASVRLARAVRPLAERSIGVTHVASPSTPARTRRPYPLTMSGPVCRCGETLACRRARPRARSRIRSGGRRALSDLLDRFASLRPHRFRLVDVRVQLPLQHPRAIVGSARVGNSEPAVPQPDPSSSINCTRSGSSRVRARTRARTRQRK